jgi:hypothetical protein
MWKLYKTEFLKEKQCILPGLPVTQAFQPKDLRKNMKKSVFLALVEEERKDAATLIQRKWREIHNRKCGWCKCTLLMNRLYWSSELCDNCHEEQAHVERENLGTCYNCGDDLYDCRGWCCYTPCCICGEDSDGGPYQGFCSRSCLRVANND